MSPTTLIELIGVLHLAQPPLTFVLARRLELTTDLCARTPIGKCILHNMGFAAIALPTSLGVVLTVHASEALAHGAGRTLAHLLAAFWCWRLYRQVSHLARVWPRAPASTRRLSHLLSALFVAKGPLLLLFLHIGRADGP